MSNKTGLSIKITGNTKEQTAALVAHLQITELEVIKLAISKFYKSELRKRLTLLVPRENDLYDVQLGGTTIATVCSDALKYVPDTTMSRLLSCGEYAGFSMILLSVAKSGEEIITYNKQFT
jgi:hypothetical protein